MALTPINLGSAPNDGKGDNLRTAGQKINDNFAAVEAALASIPGGPSGEGFSNVTTLLTNTGMKYSGGSPTVSAGQIVRTLSEGFAFVVATSGASDHHVTTAGGVKLYALPAADGSVNILQFGASTAKSNNATEINKALENFKWIRVPDGTFDITSPIVIYWHNRISGVASQGGWMGGNASRIRKTTSTAGSPLNLNAVAVGYRSGGGYVSHVILEDIAFAADTTNKVQYGIYVKDACMWNLRNVAIDFCQVGFYTQDSWLMSFDSVRVNGGSVYAAAAVAGVGTQSGWQSGSIGFHWDGQGGATSGPGNTFKSCWARNVGIGWKLRNMNYSNLQACAADQISEIAYELINAKISMNGCGMENNFCNPYGIYAFGNAYISMHGCHNDSRARGNSGSGESAFLCFDGGARVTMTSCLYQNFNATPGAGNSHNLIVKGGARFVSDNCQFPGNGNSNVGYGGGATWVRTIDGVTSWISSSGSKSSANIP